MLRKIWIYEFKGLFQEEYLLSCQELHEAG